MRIPWRPRPQQIRAASFAPYSGRGDPQSGAGRSLVGQSATTVVVRDAEVGESVAAEEVGVALRKVMVGVRRSLAPLVVPPLIGALLIAVVVFDFGDSQVTRSAAVAVTALIVGMLLILGSAALYARTPELYDEFFTDVGKRVSSDLPSPESLEGPSVGPE
jgi:hypothetical protein